MKHAMAAFVAALVSYASGIYVPVELIEKPHRGHLA